MGITQIYANFFRKNYKLFLWIADISEIYVKLFINFKTNYKLFTYSSGTHPSLPSSVSERTRQHTPRLPTSSPAADEKPRRRRARACHGRVLRGRPRLLPRRASLAMPPRLLVGRAPLQAARARHGRPRQVRRPQNRLLGEAKSTG